MSYFPPGSDRRRFCFGSFRPSCARAGGAGVSGSGQEEFCKKPEVNRSIQSGCMASNVSSWTGQNGLPPGRPRRRGACVWRNAIHVDKVSKDAAAVILLRTAYKRYVTHVQLARARRLDRLSGVHTRSPCGSSVCPRRCLVLAGARPKRRDGRSCGCSMLLCTSTDDTDTWNRVLLRVATRVGGVS